jgi:hypothetical protein
VRRNVVTVHRKRKYSTRIDIGQLKNALEDVKELNRLTKRQQTEIKRVNKLNREQAITIELMKRKIDNLENKLSDKRKKRRAYTRLNFETQ